jgi:hypothetical protein
MIAVSATCKTDPDAIGYSLLSGGLPADAARGFPVCHATVAYQAEGYAAVFGWTQMVCSPDSAPSRFEMDPIALYRQIPHPTRSLRASLSITRTSRSTGQQQSGPKPGTATLTCSEPATPTGSSIADTSPPKPAVHRHQLGHGDLTTTNRYGKILDEEDGTAADVMCSLLGNLA